MKFIVWTLWVAVVKWLARLTGARRLRVELHALDSFYFSRSLQRTVSYTSCTLTAVPM